MILRPAILAAFSLLSTPSFSEASMNDQTISGTVLDSRIASCGVRLSGSGMAVIRPFIETSASLSGEFWVHLTKRSKSGSSTIQQSNHFSGGSLGNVELAVERPSSVKLAMHVADGEGRPLCAIDTVIDLEAATHRI